MIDIPCYETHTQESAYDVYEDLKYVVSKALCDPDKKEEFLKQAASMLEI